MDNQLVCWGHEPGDPLQALAPELETFERLCASDNHFCALDPEGYATCWGQAVGIGSLPSDVAFLDISCGTSATCAIHTDGRAECWGYSAENEYFGDSLQAPALHFRSIDVDTDLACGVTLSGDIVCWGNNGEGGAEVPEGFP